MSHIESVQVYRRLIESLLAKAEELKPDKQIEPPLTETDIGDSTWRIEGSDANVLKRENQQTNYAAVETAFREKFYDLLVGHKVGYVYYIEALTAHVGYNIYRRSFFCTNMASS